MGQFRLEDSKTYIKDIEKLKKTQMWEKAVKVGYIILKFNVFQFNVVYHIL